MSSELISLSALLREGRADDRSVAFDASGDRTWAEFSAQVGSLCGRLEDRGVGRWLVCSDDSYAFAVALMAVARSGGVSVLPANARPGTLARLAPGVDGLLVDRPDEMAPGVRERAMRPLQAVVSAVPAACELDRDAPFVEFFTSGTTGEGVKVTKELRHLDDEIAVLERVFGASLKATRADVAGEAAAGEIAAGEIPARVVATVSHQHIYGALFRVLWPLAAGRPFSATTYLHGSEVAARLSAAPGVLVSTPVQLKAMAAGGVLAGVSLAAVFSSGAPLDAATAIAITGQVGVAPIEVFGSTETGGVAWRRRPRGGDVAWRPLPGVAVDRDASGALRVRSPFVSVGGTGGFAMGDRIEFDATGHFRIRGRVDRIVKIGSKRLSLPEMEAEIARHEYVDDVGLLLLQRGSEERVGAVVALSAAGRSILTDSGKPVLRRQLTAALEPYFDRVLLPRVWRFVDRLPRDTQSKLPAAELRALFESGETSRVREAIVRDSTIGDRVLERQCVVPEDLEYCNGHFPSFPVVPGVVLLGWVVDAAQAILAAPVRVATVEALKFKHPLAPGSRFDLRVEVDDASETVRFRFTRDGDELSSGRLKLS